MAVDKSENFAEKDDSEFCNCNVIHEDVVNYVRSGMLEQTQFEKLSMFFKAISDETRIKILYSLSRSKMCVCDLAALLGMTASAISHQLRVLRQAELVRSEAMRWNILWNKTGKIKGDNISCFFALYT